MGCEAPRTGHCDAEKLSQIRRRLVLFPARTGDVREGIPHSPWGCADFL